MITNYCILDLETTGIDTQNDRIIEIGVIKMFKQQQRIEKRHLINPTITIPNHATKVHGITNEQVKDCPTFKQIAKGLLDFINGYDIIGYNTNNFDVPLLYNEFCRAGLIWNLDDINFIDVCNIYKITQPRTLSDAAKFYLREDHTGAHGALEDCKMTEKVFLQQLYDKELNAFSADELAVFSNYGKKRIDIAGKFSRDENNVIIFAFGKHKGKPAKSEKNYLEWMFSDKADFNGDTKMIAKKLYYNQPL